MLPIIIALLLQLRNSPKKKETKKRKVQTWQTGKRKKLV